MIVFGTRPETIKLLPIIKELNKYPEEFKTTICVTAQHRELLDQVLDLFEVTADYDLDIMQKNQSLSLLTVKIIEKFDPIVNETKPDYIIVQGDTTTTFIASLIGFYHHISILHVEAGLRTNNRYSPFPEEINRRLTSVLTEYHFVPTECAKVNLLNENYKENKIFITGNTTIDSLFYTLKKNKDININIPELNGVDLNKKLVIITGHRRENFGEGFLNICKAIRTLSIEFPQVNFIYPVHLNPNVQEPVYSLLDNLTNVFLIKPLDYREFVYLMAKSTIILTDSGGIQEEAPSIGKPLIVMRDTTERPEVVEQGAAKLVGTNTNNIVNEVKRLLISDKEYSQMAQIRHIYGDGYSSKKIIKILREM